MNGIEVFLVLTENRKDVCYIETKEVKVSNVNYPIMHYSSIDKCGLTLKGKKEDEETITFKLLSHYKKELDNERKELDKKTKLFNKLRIKCLD